MQKSARQLSLKRTDKKVIRLFYQGLVGVILIFSTISSRASVISATSSGDSTDIVLSLPQIDWEYAGTDSFPRFPEAPFISLADAPELPKLVYTFLFDESRSYQIKILETQDTLVEASIAPSRGFVSFDEKDRERKMGPEYFRDEFFPSTRFLLNDEFFARNKTGRTLEIYPFQFNPAAHQLRIYTSVKIRIYHPKSSLKSSQLLPNSVISNPDLKWLSTDNYGSMLILAPDSFKLTLKPFIDWKKQKGIPVYFVASDSVSGYSGVKNLVTQFYIEKKILYLLIAGDHQQVPSYSGLYGAGDNHYGYLAGADFYLDISVGRFPAETRNQLASMISKSINYEKGIGFGTEIINYLGISSGEKNIGDQAETDDQHIQNIGSELFNSGFSSSLISPTLNSLSISSGINRGCGIMCYSGHGNEYMLKTTGFGADSIENLTNTNYHPFFIDVACLNGSFTRTTCFAEKIMRKQHGTKPAGTVAILASTISQPWNPPMSGQDEMIRQITGTSQYGKSYTLGSISSGGFFKMINDYGAGGMETASTWNLFGDPSLYLWSSVPQVMSISCEEKFNVRSEHFQVKGEDNSLVTLFMKGEILDTAIIQNGIATLSPGIITMADSVILTAVKSGCIPVQKVLAPYSDGGPYYGMHECVLVDENGILENDETFLYQAKITNHGNSAGRNVRVEVLSFDSCFRIENRVVLCDSILPGSTVTSPGFAIRTTSENADQTTGIIQFKISDDQGQVNYFNQELTINSPILKIANVLVNDQELVNNQLVFQKDTLKIRVVLSNSGHAPATNQSCSLQLESFFMDFLGNSDFSFSINPQSSDTLYFFLKVNPDIAIGETVSARLSLNDSDLNDQFELIAKQGLEVTLGSQQFSVPEFPFYNYYKSNKSQFLIRSDELNLKNPIDSLGFYISNFPNSESQTTFKNLSIRFLSSSVKSLGINYTSMDSSVLVAKFDSYKIPRKKGWVTFDVSDFNLTSGKNLIVEVVWGLNSYSTSYQNSFEVYAHKTDYSCSTFGYHDTQYPPPVRNTDQYRPDLRLVPKPAAKNPISFALFSEEQIPYFSYQIKIGTQILSSNPDGIVNLSLPVGSFPVEVFDGSAILISDTIRITETTETVSWILNSRGSISGIELKDEPVLITFGHYYLNVDLKDGQNSAVLELYTTAGARIWRKVISSRQRIYLGNLPQSIYLLSVNQKFSTKIINY